MLILKTNEQDRQMNSLRIKELRYAIENLDAEAFGACLQKEGTFNNTTKYYFIRQLSDFFAFYKNTNKQIIIHEGISLDTLPGAEALVARFELIYSLDRIFDPPTHPNLPAGENEKVLGMAFTFRNGKINTLKLTRKIMPKDDVERIDGSGWS